MATERNDRLEGTNGADVLSGLGGNDVIIGMAGDDQLHGGDGHDRLFGGNHNDVLDGGAGNDLLKGGAGADWLVGGAGMDAFEFSFGMRPVRNADGTVSNRYTGEGADVIADFSRADGDRLQVSGISAVDVVNFRVTEVDVNADGQLDTVIQLITDPSWSLTLLNHVGFDASLDVTLTLAEESPTAFQPEVSTIVGTAEGDLLGGAPVTDSIDGQGGMDVIHGGSGHDVIVGGNGSDTMAGGDGADLFVLKFGMRTVKAGSSDFATWRSPDLPPLQDGALTHREFSGQYTVWLKHLMRTHALGRDVDGDGVVSVDTQLNTADSTPLIEGMTAAELATLFGPRKSIWVDTNGSLRERFYSSSFSMGEREIYSGNGRDVVLDFDSATGDRLVLSGITAETIDLFRLRYTDVDSDGSLDAIITLQSDPVWSLTLLGVDDFRPVQDVIWA